MTRKELEEKRAEAVALWQNGYSQVEASAATGVPQRTISGRINANPRLREARRNFAEIAQHKAAQIAEEAHKITMRRLESGDLDKSAHIVWGIATDKILNSERILQQASTDERQNSTLDRFLDILEHGGEVRFKGPDRALEAKDVTSEASSQPSATSYGSPSSEASYERSEVGSTDD